MDGSLEIILSSTQMHANDVLERQTIPKWRLKHQNIWPKIAFEHNPKFLGITFDTRLKFDKHLEKVKEKVNDRINILKVLSYDRCWGLNVNYLLSVYKVLVRSVMDYANVVTAACNIKVVRDLEVLQNDALRVIFKKSVMDHIPVQTLLQWADIESILSL